jgi:hypothetical protein
MDYRDWVKRWTIETRLTTHEANRDFKTDRSHASGTHSHAIAIIPDRSRAAETLRFVGFDGPLQLDRQQSGQKGV